MHQEHTEKDRILSYIFPLVILSVFIIGYLPAFQKMLIRWGGGDSSYGRWRIEGQRTGNRKEGRGKRGEGRW